MESKKPASQLNGSDDFRKPRIRIVIADDHPLMRQALKMWLKKQPDFEVIAEAGDGEEAVKLVRELSPDIVIMDISMPKLNGIEATRQISRECPTVATLVLTVHSDNDTALSILQAGAAGYLIKTASGKQVVQAVRTILGGEAVWSLPIHKIIQSTSSNRQRISLGISTRLSPREVEVVKLLAKGKSNKDIALRLGLRETSVKSYLASLFVKLGVGTRTAAVSVSLQAGILTVDDFNEKRH